VVDETRALLGACHRCGAPAVAFVGTGRRGPEGLEGEGEMALCQAHLDDHERASLARGRERRVERAVARIARCVDRNPSDRAAILDRLRRACFPEARAEVGKRVGARPLVGVVMGSASDWSTMKFAADTLRALGIPYEARVVSAHRTPDLLYAYAEGAKGRLAAIIAGAGGAAHLPGMLASKTRAPVLGVPIQSEALRGLDSLLSMVQMPGGAPVATFAIGKAGAINAALFAAEMLAPHGPDVELALTAFFEEQTRKVMTIGPPNGAPPCPPGHGVRGVHPAVGEKTMSKEWGVEEVVEWVWGQTDDRALEAVQKAVQGRIKALTVPDDDDADDAEGGPAQAPGPT